MPPLETILQILAIAVLIIGTPRLLWATRARALLAEKDSTIETHKQTLESKKEQIETLSADRDGARAAANTAALEARRATLEAGEWKARYEEQSKYTAEAALQAIETMMTEQSRDAERRHQELMTALSKIQGVEGKP